MKYKNVFIILFILYINITLGQHNVLKGNWISEKKEWISISSDLNKQSSMKSLNEAEDFFRLKIISDTLNFQNEWFVSEDNFKETHNDLYNLKVMSLNDSVLIVKPISQKAIEFFATNDSIKFKNQKYSCDTSFEFEKLIFHTTSCFGSCPIINLEIASDKTFKLNAEYFQKHTRNKKDTNRSGSFTGKLSDADFDMLINYIIQSEISKIEDTVANGFCCDGSIKTIILYHNGKRNYYKTMFPSVLERNLITFLYEIDQKKELTRSDVNFSFEQ